MNARFSRTKMTIVVPHGWEPEPSAGYAELDRAISAGLSELVDRAAKVPRGAHLTQRQSGQNQAYLHFLGCLIEHQRRATAQPRTLLGHLVARVCQWLCGISTRDTETTVPVVIDGYANRLRTRHEAAFRR